MGLPVEWRLVVKTHPEKGRCVHSDEPNPIPSGQLICEYGGSLVSLKEGLLRERNYTAIGAGCYIYFFNHNGQTLCIDATDESMPFDLGRLVNHSRLHPNLIARKLTSGRKHEVPRIVYVSIRDIQPGEELLVDYGDRSTSIGWLNNT
ncbi:MAG: SET domain-containing protein-lysine N-methyltransferase [Undibacterium sp.]